MLKTKSNRTSAYDFALIHCFYTRINNFGEKIKAEEEESTLGNANRQPAVVPRCTGMSLGLVKDSRITETAADATH